MDLSCEDMGCNLQYISDWENIDDLNMEFNFLDYFWVSIIFFSKFQMDVREKCKSFFINYYFLG